MNSSEFIIFCFKAWTQTWRSHSPVWLENDPKSILCFSAF